MFGSPGHSAPQSSHCTCMRAARQRCRPSCRETLASSAANDTAPQSQPTATGRMAVSAHDQRAGFKPEVWQPEPPSVRPGRLRRAGLPVCRARTHPAPCGRPWACGTRPPNGCATHRTSSAQWLHHTAQSSALLHSAVSCLTHYLICLAHVRHGGSRCRVVDQQVQRMCNGLAA